MNDNLRVRVAADGTLSQDTRFLIVGLGLIGGSYADALTARGYDVSAITKDASSIDYALSHHMIARGTTAVDPALLKAADFIVFGLYPGVLVDWLEHDGEHIAPGTLVTDVTGVKEEIVPAVRARLLEGVSFVGSHPMAGREVSGVENATARLLTEANFLVTPTPENTPEEVEAVAALGRTLGVAKVSFLTPAAHDDMIGYVSQLTHVIAMALMNANATEELVDYTGDSFRDLTRIAHINDRMWSDLFFRNREALLGHIDRFSEEIATIRETIARRDEAGLRALMQKSTARRDAFNRRARDEVSAGYRTHLPDPLTPTGRVEGQVEGENA
ncbi:MAG: prephenate dehydrogenase/arogenate dehydrogenase family protein [Peptoniphilaceae bacterium]|nr:prephenate dehydrogenase/arogenate dehydrogenase family protein [Peptoniphilaceae bacterium]MDY6086290.1 prephenate dehydrogenase/arogenate dehydrogenase family protein [Peptoniphilaceae bacterium]